MSRVSTGFTLIELLVVVSITVLLMMTISIFFLTFIVGSTKAVFEQKIKRDGETALEQASTMLRNARFITTCSTGMTSISFTGRDNLVTTLTGDSNRFASMSAITDPVTPFYLTSDFSNLVPANTVIFDCYLAGNNQHYIEISFTLKKGTSASNDQNTLTRSFKTGVTVRNDFLIN
jgi:prepilin-type N-terminal cleavage/methylation domain-containing protein